MKSFKLAVLMVALMLGFAGCDDDDGSPPPVDATPSQDSGPPPLDP